MKKIFLFLAAMALAVTLLPGCAGLGGTSQTSSTGFGGIEVRVTDAQPDYIIEEVWINFSEVWVHRAGDGSEEEEVDSEDGGEWIKLGLTGSSFDLVKLGKEGLETLLATSTKMTAGKYTQIRVVIDEAEDKGVQVVYRKTEGGPSENVTAKLPSGVLKFVRPFYVVDGITTILTLDFDLAKSVNFTGSVKGGKPKIIVKPVVKISVEQADIDLALTADNITFDPAHPVSGDNVTIMAAIQNAGDIDLNNVVVRFYDGEPADGNQINGDQIIANIPVGGSGNASVKLNSVVVNHDIYVVVDPDDLIPESDETNNVASKIIHVNAP